MTIFQVMGDALINSHKLQSKTPKGPCLYVDYSLKQFIPGQVDTLEECENQFIGIDWIHTNTDTIKKIYSRIECHFPPPSQVLENLLKRYIESHDLKDEWKRNAMNMLPNQT
jgi:hypothetical protein